MRKIAATRPWAVLLPMLLLQLPVHAALSDQETRTVAVVRQATESMNRGDLDTYASFFAPNTVNFGNAVGRQGIRDSIGDIVATFPDYKHTIVEIVAQGVPPTRKHFDVQHIHWYKVRDGTIVEHTANRDDIGMMRQLGLLPAEGLPR